MMFNIVEKRRWYFLFSAILIAFSIGAMVVSIVQFGQPVRPGIDFAGGSIFVLKLDHTAGEDEIRTLLADHGLESSIVQPRGAPEEQTWQVRTREVTDEEINSLLVALEEQVGEIDREALHLETVEPAIGSEVARSAGLAILAAVLGTIAFTWFSFRHIAQPWRYGICGVAVVAHNLLVVFGFCALMGIFAGWEVSALVLTGILIVVGFSAQDVIVVFERIRENTSRHKMEPFETVANRAILEAMPRSLATQLCALFVMIAILLFGGTTLKPFIATVLVGTVSETYAAIFIAVELLVAWEKAAARRAKARATA
jgi:preprotein translocase SecF subunit